VLNWEGLILSFVIAWTNPANMAAELHNRMDTPHKFIYNPNPKTIAWERLEKARLESIGLCGRYSRHFNVTRSPRGPKQPGLSGSCLHNDKENETTEKRLIEKAGASQNNSLAPFTTVGKSTCGVYFNFNTCNVKRKFGIPPSDLVRWRSSTTAN